MLETQSHPRWRPSRTGLIATGLVAAGFLLCSVSWWFFLLVAAGMFGPGILRELDWLDDKDEFQRRADHRAGYHAFLITGVVAVVLVAFVRSSERDIKDAQELASLLLALLGCTWIFSSLAAFWGVHKCVRRILIGFGLAWLAFAIASSTGQEWQGIQTLLVKPLITLPFFLLAALVHRIPRSTGLVLLVAAGFLTWFLGSFGPSKLGLVTRGLTFLMLQGPLIACGIALLGAPRADADDDEEDDHLPHPSD